MCLFKMDDIIKKTDIQLYICVIYNHSRPFVALNVQSISQKTFSNSLSNCEYM